MYTMFHPLKQAYAFILDKRFQYPSIDLTPRTWVISYNFQWTIGTFTIRVDEVASPLHTHHTHFRNSIAWSTWVNRPRAMLWMMHFRRSYSPLLFSFLVFFFSTSPFTSPIEHLAHTKVHRVVQENGQAKIVKVRLVVWSRTEFLPEA